MRSVLLALLAGTLSVAPALPGQTTGVPFINDYTITCAGCGTGTPLCFPPGTFGGAGGVSGSTSCTALWFDVSAGGSFTFNVSCAPGAPVAIFLDLCPCVPCWLPLPPVCGLPFTACGGTTNQSVDLDLTCVFNNLFTGLANTAGVFSATITVPPFPPGFCFRASTQALILGSTAACVPPPLVSQAYDIVLGG